jgi:hypothetical protein
MVLSSKRFSEVKENIAKNCVKTKQVFPEETQHIENGLALLWEVTQSANDAEKEFSKKPNLLANRNLFGRNRQLLLNAYSCMLGSDYGTHFVILRTVLENNNLMRLFDLQPIYAFEWLPKEEQKQSSSEFQATFCCLTEKRNFNPFWVLKTILSEERKKKAKSDTQRIYGQLCDYTHPNFVGWQEIMGMKDSKELLLDLPTFSSYNSEHAVVIMLFLTQLSLKTFVESFIGYWSDHALQIYEWQEKFNKLIVKYIS